MSSEEETSDAPPPGVDESRVQEEVSRVRNLLRTRPRIALVGFTGAGKSTLFNAILGRNLAESAAGGVRGTLVGQAEEKEGLIFVDCPGYGAANLRPPEVILQETKDPHLVLLVLNGGETVHEQDVALYKVLASHVRTIVALNKVDVLDPEEIEEIQQEVKDRLGVPSERFIAVSARTGHNVDELVKLMTSVLPAGAREGFLGSLEGRLELKSQEALRIVNFYAGSGAVLGLTPIPMADLIALYPLQAAMTIHVGQIYGHGDLPTRDVLTLVTGAFGAAFAMKLAMRQLFKFIPILGSAVGAVTAFASIQAYGRTIIYWFETGMKLPKESLREYFNSQYEKAEQEARKMDFEQLKKQREESDGKPE